MSKSTDNPLREPPQEWLDLQGLTQYATVCERTLRAWIHSPVNPLPAVRVGKKFLIRRRDFDEWLEGHRFESPNSLAFDAMVDEIVGDVVGRK
jgi:excisionase family DNA binding protein